MAILLNGMTAGEIARWTAAMIASGERLDLSGVGRPTVDKHSTGGVGDKITLPLTPLVAACGAAVPQLSGRGLGHTGGTLDKLEAVAGFGTKLSNEAFVEQLRTVGAAICAAGEGLAPADRKLYALRDVTGTVEAIPLIASSIMSKKIAEGTGALVLDVKFGSGAFMRQVADARELARTMVELGKAHGVTTVALLTDMEVPLGRTVGHSLEVEESLEVLAGGGPQDVVALTLALAREMLDAVGLGDVDPARRDRRRAGHGLVAGPLSAPRAATRTRRCPWPTRSRRSPPPATASCHHGRLRHRRGRLAPRRGPGPQGGPGQRLGRHHPAPQARRGGPGRRRDHGTARRGRRQAARGAVRGPGRDHAGGDAAPSRPLILDRIS